MLMLFKEEEWTKSTQPIHSSWLNRIQIEFCFKSAKQKKGANVVNIIF